MGGKRTLALAYSESWASYSGPLQVSAVVRMVGQGSASEVDDLPAGPIVLFDAECVLCSANAQFILSHDKTGRFHLASMQGAVGSELFRKHGLDPADPVTILVIDGPKVRKNSDALLRIYEELCFPWRLA